jgi:hypothetical protein
LAAHHLLAGENIAVRQTAWYTKPLPTVTDPFALVRRDLSCSEGFAISPTTADMVDISRRLWAHLTTTLACTAQMAKVELRCNHLLDGGIVRARR